MKPYFIFVAGIALLAASPLSAQEHFFIGVTAGASSTKLSGDVVENGSYTSKPGFSAGLVGEFALTNDIRLSIQPSYVRRGTGVAFDIDKAELRDSLKLTLDYMSIPVMARFLTPGGIWFVNGGLDLGFLFDASLEDINAGRTSNVKDLINDVDLMMIFGVGATAHFKPLLVSVELRYGQSVINAGANVQLAAAKGISPRFRSSGFQLLASVLYPL